VVAKAGDRLAVIESFRFEIAASTTLVLYFGSLEVRNSTYGCVGQDNPTGQAYVHPLVVVVGEVGNTLRSSPAMLLVRELMEFIPSEAEIIYHGGAIKNTCHPPGGVAGLKSRSWADRVPTNPSFWPSS
jgi:hypothetical protein